MRPTKEEPTTPEIYYDKKRGNYWLRWGEGPFLNLEKNDVKMHLRAAAFKVDAPKEVATSPDDQWDYGLKEGDYALVRCQLDRGIDYAGPLAGHRIGPAPTQGGATVLVTSEANYPQAKKGLTPHLDKFLFQLLGPEQSRYFLYWLKCARETLLKQDFRPGQMLVLAGPSGCGKSLLQCLVTEFLGGRVAKPYRYMIGESQFNSDLAAAEHLVIADEQASVDIRSRRNFGARIKDMTVNTEMSVQAKGKDSITLKTSRRISLSLNHEAENLMILPPIDESLEDKLMLFGCMFADVGPDRLEVWKTYTSELPALAWKLEKMTIPKEDQCPRYGVKAYHNATLIEMVSSLSPEQRLLQLIEETWFAKSSDPFTGTATELELMLRKSDFSFAVDKLLHFSSACGVYLARLATRYPQRITEKTTNGKRKWIITHEPTN